MYPFFCNSYNVFWDGTLFIIRNVLLFFWHNLTAVSSSHVCVDGYADKVMSEGKCSEFFQKSAEDGKILLEVIISLRLNEFI